MRRSMLWGSALAALAMALGAGEVRASDLTVVASIKPIHSIVSAVMAGVAEPKLLIDGTASPHTFTLKPSDAKALAGAHVVFHVSRRLEPFLIKVAQSLPNTVQVVELESVAGLTLRKMRSGGTFEAHDHGARDHDHNKKEKHDHSSDADSTNAIDAHIYLDPVNAALIATHITEVLTKAHPDGADRFKTNAEAFGREMAALTLEIEAKTKPLADRPFVVFHDAYQYFEARFGLSAVGSVTVSPEVAPSAKRLSSLRRRIGQLKAVCVFAEPQFEPRLVATITEKTNAKRGVLDPLGVSIPAGSAHYAALLRKLATDLETCLK